MTRFRIDFMDANMGVLGDILIDADDVENAMTKVVTGVSFPPGTENVSINNLDSLNEVWADEQRLQDEDNATGFGDINDKGEEGKGASS